MRPTLKTVVSTLDCNQSSSSNSTNEVQQVWEKEMSISAKEGPRLPWIEPAADPNLGFRADEVKGSCWHPVVAKTKAGSTLAAMTFKNEYEFPAISGPLNATLDIFYQDAIAFKDSSQQYQMTLSGTDLLNTCLRHQ